MQEGTILIAEDNSDDELLTIRSLKKAGILNPIIVARDGEAIVELLFGENSPPSVSNIHLVLLDIKLPKIDGLEVLRRIRENEKTRRLPVTILTSSKEEKDVVTSYNLGANSYICKPVDIEQFMKAVQELGLYWLLLNQKPS